MSLYNLLFGVTGVADAALAAAGLDRQAVGRFRDAWFARAAGGDPIVAEPIVVVHTRNGGGNRAHWDGYGTGPGATCTCPGCIITYAAQRFPNFLEDEDTAYDCTYADMTFAVLPAYRDEALLLASEHPPLDTEARWATALAALRAGGPR